MNILILANKPPYPAKDGSSLATLCLTEGLAKSGNRTTILAISTPKHPCRIEQIPIELRQLIDFNLVDINTKISLHKGVINFFFSNKPYNIERFIDSSYVRKLTQIIKANSFDIIQIEGLYLAPYINTIKELTSVPIVYRSHNIEHEIWHRLAINEKNWLKSQYYALLSKRIRKMETDITRQVNAIAAITKRDEQWFIDNGFIKPSITIPMGYSIPNSSEISNSSNNELCFLGSLDWKPNQEGLIWFIDKVWPSIHKEYPTLTFHVAGRNAPATIKSKLKKEIGIFFHGEVEGSQNFLSTYSILVAPILSGSGMRVKIVEGMMNGNVVVTTSMGIEGIDAINHEHAIIIDTPSDFAQEIIELIRQPKYRASIAEKARIFAMEHFDNSKLTKELDIFYKQLI